jgi:hypothetical protein
MAVWSSAAIEEARELALNVRFQSTCCSVGYHPRFRFIGKGSA